MMQIRWRLALRRLLHHAADLERLALLLADADHAIEVRLIGGHFLDRDHTRAVAEPAVCVNHLLEAAGLRHHQHVGKDDGERLIADEFTRAPDRVTEPERRLLARERCRAGGRQHLGEHGQLGRLVARAQGLLQLILQVEVVLDRILVAAGHEDEMLDPGLARLVDHQLDGRPVHDREHLLRNSLGGRQKARTETGNREDGFANGFHGTCAGNGTYSGSIQGALRTGKPQSVPYHAAMTSRMSP